MHLPDYKEARKRDIRPYQRVVFQEDDKVKNKYQGKIDFKLSSKVLKELVNLTDYNEYGARKVDKVVKDKLENIIIEALLDDKENVYIKNIMQTV